MTLLDAAARVVDPLAAEDRPCCVYAHRVLALAYGLPWEDLTSWHLWDVARPWSPVEAAVRAGVGSCPGLPPAAPITLPDRWHLCQGWRGTPGAPGVTGHTWLWRDLGGGRGLRLDCAEAQWRPAPYHQEAIERWADRVAPYKGGVAVAVLRRLG